MKTGIMKFAVETNKRDDQLRNTPREEPVKKGMEMIHGRTKVNNMEKTILGK